MSDFLDAYKKIKTEKFNLSLSTQPIIVLVDKDKGWAKVAQKIGKNADGNQSFYHVHANLYVVCIPPPPGMSEGAIEDLYTEATRSLKWNDKSFDKTNNITDKGNHYGKMRFADSVVLPNARTIDFDGFKPLLDRLVAVIDDYSKRKRTT